MEGVAFFLRAVDLRPGVQDIPSLVVSLRAPWLELPVADFVNSMHTVYQGVLNGIFRQMPIAAWFRAQCKRIQLTIVLPSGLSLEDWQTTLLRRTSCWPFRLPQDMTALHPPSKATFIRLRKRGQSKHILGGLDIDWKLIDQHLWTRGPSVLTRDELERQLFLLRSSSTTEVVYRGNDRDKWNLWTQQRALVWMSQSTRPAQMTLRVSAWILWGRTNYQAYLDWLDHLEHQQTQSGRFKTKKGYWVVKRRPQS